MRKIEFSIFKILVISSLVYSFSALSETDWVTVTLDNDLFVGNDDGYTNGLYVSKFDVGDKASGNLPENDFWVLPLIWSMPESAPAGAVNAYMLGQTMNTPSDITIVDPDENELPYSAMLALTNSYLVVTPKYADRISTTVGIVGPAALGEEAQTFVHKLIGSAEPQGWDTQLENEFVFRLSRGRTWRALHNQSGIFDLLINADVSVGTIQSAVSSGFVARYGRDLLSSYATSLFNSSRTSNPGAVNGGWYMYIGLTAGYLANQIFTDGNTFEDSRSIDYDREFLAFSAGIAYSFKQLSVTFALNDSNLIQQGNEEEALENLTRYGTITLGWKL